MLLGFHSGVSAGQRYAIERAAGGEGARQLGPPIRPVKKGPTSGREFLAPLKLRVPDSQELSVVRRLLANPAVAYAEPDYLQHADATPNDPSFPLQWADNNTGQSIPTQNQEEVLGPSAKGTAGADDRALQAWGITTGSRTVVIGEVDTGVDYAHPDLAGNIWSNPGGINGCAAGTHGYNVVGKTCDPLDQDATFGGHGTHVGGILGAVGNNATGIAGINWQTSILPVKWMQNASSGETSALVEALQWLVAAKQAGVNVRVVNDSDTFFGTARSEALSNEIDTLGANNILFVTAAGNTGNNNDEVSVQRYPCSYERANEICVTATNNNDQLPSWANYGPHTVQLGAPGVSIYSTLRGGRYGYLTGGSMASPQVAGAAALILSASPSLSTTSLRSDILENVDKMPSLEGKVITGGRLNVCKAMPGCVSAPAPLTFGKTTVGASSDSFSSERKRVSRYSLPTSGAVTKLSIYLAPTSVSGQQVMKGVVYSDASGKPEALLGVSEQLAFTSTSVAGWYDLPFSTPLKLTAGNYWIGIITGATLGVAGFRYDSVSGARDYNANSYASGPSNPFGSFSTDSEQTSLFAAYTTPPVNTSPPTITGTPQQGQTLTEVHGTWTNSPTSYAYQWLRCESNGSGCAAISGATAQTYVLAAADVGHTLKVQETASNPEGASSPATSSATAVVLALAPVNTLPPTITGTAQQGQTLTEVHGTWTNSPTSYAYQWLRCESNGSGCAAISGATAQTYVLAAADVGHTLKVQETASNPEGASSPATSSATAVVLALAPVNTLPPTITGTAQQGQTLTEVHGTWTNSPTSYAYQWLRCESNGSGCAAIFGATAQTYVLAAADVGHTLKVQETASNASGTSGPSTSAATAAVAPQPPSNTSPPTITGTPQQGRTLTEQHGSWTNEPTSYAYQWLQCDILGLGCLPISGATAQTYVPEFNDVGHTLRVQETASNAGGSGDPATSEPTSVVLLGGPVPASTAAPTITGTTQQGQTLTEHSGSWDNEPTSFSYQWLQCDSSGGSCTAISGATAQTYLLTSSDVGHTIEVQEVATNTWGSSSPATSSPTASVLPLPPTNTSPPTISGTAQEGQTLTEAHGTWTNSPTSYAYQWLQCDAFGTSCLPISGATAQSYSPVAADVGHTLAVQETASNEGGAGSPATSSATAVVQAPNATFGKTTVGSSPDRFLAERKRVNRYELPTQGSVTKLSIYLRPGGVSGQQVLEGLIYSDSAGSPNALLGVSQPITFTSSSATGWYDLPFASSVNLPAGSYWIGVITGQNAGVAGFRYDTVAASRDYNNNSFSSGPTSTFGSFKTDAEQTSLYATYTPG